MTTKKLQVRCECEPRDTIGSLMTKITVGAAELQRTLDSKPTDFLALSFFSSKPCSGCDGKGFINVANGPEDFDKVTCEECNGTGRVVANN